MEFQFRGKTVSMENCIVLKKNSLVFIREKQFTLDSTTLAHFGKKEKNGSLPDASLDSDSTVKKVVCRSLSFKSMAVCICRCFNNGKPKLIGELLKAVYLADSCSSMPCSRDSDQRKAYNIYKKICSPKADYTELCNELLYILGNAYTNLHTGMSSGGRTSDAYNPSSWKYSAENGYFALSGEDFKRLKPLIDADLQSVLSFYVSTTAEGEEPKLYSSDNSPYVSSENFNSFPAEISVCDEKEEIRISKYETDI